MPFNLRLLTLDNVVQIWLTMMVNEQTGQRVDFAMLAALNSVVLNSLPG